jgi:hypothetical protein
MSREGACSTTTVYSEREQGKALPKLSLISSRQKAKKLAVIRVMRQSNAAKIRAHVVAYRSSAKFGAATTVRLSLQLMVSARSLRQAVRIPVVPSKPLFMT